MAVGVFGLQVAYKLKRTELLSSEDTHGWFGGGLVPAPTATLSSVERIDFSNDTSTPTPRGALSVARRSLTATGNSNFGWFGGGWFTPSTPQINYSTIDRINFSNDSVTALARGPLASTRYNVAATANSNYGWFGGGQLFDPVTPANTRKSSVDRIDFSNDSPTASPRGPLSLARSALAATGNSNFGWFGGGVNPSTPAIFSTVDRIDFSNDSVIASQRGTLNSFRTGLAATGNSNYGWFGGGYTTGGVNLDRVERIDFANDSVTASIRGPLASTTRNRFAATGNSNYGWFGGGPVISAVDRINFSNDTATASVRGSLSSSRENSGATSGQAKTSSIRLQKTGNFGWFGGGYAPAPPGTGGQLSTVDRINFSNDSSMAPVRGSLSAARYWFTATSNSNYGWFGGGLTYPSIERSIIDRIDFSNDLATASVRQSLQTAKLFLSATGNSNYGWFGGGSRVPGPTFTKFSTIERVNFSSDLSSTSPRGPLNVITNDLAATGNSNYGWFGGGNFISTIVDRIDFSNDLALASPRGPLSSARYAHAATGNSNFGWFGGGTVFPGGARSTVERIDFSNDSAIASPRGNLSNIKTNPGATGNSNYGWFGGGGNFISSIVDRIDFANDSATASPRGNLSLSRGLRGNSSVSNTPIG